MFLAVAWAAVAAPWRRGSLALALSWAVGQVWWLSTGDALPVTLYRVLDIAVIAALFFSPRSRLDYIILAGFAGQWWAYSNMQGAAQWWTLFWFALAQMVAAGPWAQIQKARFSVSHGPMRAGGAI